MRHPLSLLGCCALWFFSVIPRGHAQGMPDVLSMGDHHAVSTFQCIGIRWKPDVETKPERKPICHVRYRVSGASVWMPALPLWWDHRDGEYRGSIVNLQPHTDYSIQLALSSHRASKEFSARTWPAKFPIARTITLSGLSDQMLKVRDSGTADGYTLYCPAERGESVIDVQGKQDACIRIRASYVVISGMTLRGAGIHAIYLDEGVHDVVIEGCNISGWGRIEKDGWGRNYDGALFSRSRTAERIVVQGNLFHHPRSDANSWAEKRPLRGDPNNHHPAGPQVVFLAESKGNHVFRFNTVTSDETHQFNDIFGAAKNYSRVGFPNCDSDIYGNYLSHCWDDAIESEGANRNVRIWGNYITNSYVGIATATTSVGPLYLWRNVIGVSRKSPERASRENHGAFLKHSDRLGGGRIYVFHNTLLQGRKLGAKQGSLGCGTAMGWGGPMLNVTSRNNVLATEGVAIADRNQDPEGDYDYDLFNGSVRAKKGSEPHGIRAVPVYRSGSPLHPQKMTGDFSLSPDSPGHDAGQRLPGFNDEFTGRSPDMGSQESGTPPMRFGVEAMPVKWQHRKLR